MKVFEQLYDVVVWRVRAWRAVPRRWRPRVLACVRR